MPSAVNIATLKLPFFLRIYKIVFIIKRIQKNMFINATKPLIEYGIKKILKTLTIKDEVNNAIKIQNIIVEKIIE
ncbi:hypothetical protein RIVM261_078760 [Rivularia sp. IAM M-261]|nr:hypothetical protein RIVM261_078760 [Rivularia sp. IAM M-261]